MDYVSRDLQRQGASEGLPGSRPEPVRGCLYAASANETKTSLPVGSCASMKPKEKCN